MSQKKPKSAPLDMRSFALSPSEVTRLGGRFWRSLATGSLLVLSGLVLAGEARAAKVDRHLERPSSQAFLAPRTTPTSSFIERSVSWPADGTLEFDYFVDAELNRDFFGCTWTALKSSPLPGPVARGGRRST